jgi:hypothetical protein
MTAESKREDSAPSEMMVPCIEIENPGDAAREKEITDAVAALTGVREVTIAKGALP